MAAIARLRAVALDCPDPRALAEFYRALVGGELQVVEDEWVSLRDGGAVRLSFQRVEDHRPPSGLTANRHNSFTSTSRSTMSTRPRPRCSRSARPNTPPNPAIPTRGVARTTTWPVRP